MSRTNEKRHIKWHETCRIIINAGVNAKNWLIKVYSIKNLFGIQVIANENAMNYVIRSWKMCRKMLVDKLVEKCTENDEEAKMTVKTLKKTLKISINSVLAHCTWRCFQ